MRYLPLTLATATIFISGCIHIAHNNQTKKVNSKSKLTSLSNEGTICLSRSAPKEITIKYYPLSSNCVSSTAIDWKLAGIDAAIKNDNLTIESYALYKRNNSQINTKDCAGARVSTKKIATPTNSTKIYWGSRVLTTIDSNKNRVCFKKEGNLIKSINKL
jgi:hypothetical protein